MEEKQTGIRMQVSTKNIVRIVTTVVLTLLGLAIAFGLLWNFKVIIFYILISAVLAIIGRPLARLIKKVTIKGFTPPNWLAALLSLLAIWAVAVLFFSIFIPLVFSKLSALASLDFHSILDSLQHPISKFEGFIENNFAVDADSFSIKTALVTQIGKLFNMNAINSFVGSIVSTVGSTLIALFAITFITFFFLKDEDMFLTILLAISPSKYEENIKHALNTSGNLLTRYFLGILAESTMMMLMVSISLIFCGYGASNAFFIGLIIGVLNVIPYVGPWLGFFISLLISIALMPTLGMSLVFIIFSLGLTVLGAQMVDNFILQPLLYSNSVNAHPLEIFIVILLAGHFGGVLGMILAIPTYTVIRVIAKEFFYNFKIVRKLTENL